MILFVYACQSWQWACTQWAGCTVLGCCACTVVAGLLGAWHIWLGFSKPK